MHVSCPHCSTRYVLPESLLGAHGARVRCPRCRESFAVGSDGTVTAVPAASEPIPAPAADPPVAEPEATPEPALATAAIRAALDRALPDPGEVRAVPPSPPPGLAVAIQRMREMLGGGAPPAEPVAPAAPPPARTESAHDVAAAVLGELEAHSGEAIASAQAEGKFFVEYGAVIVEAFEFYRRRLGPAADPAPFRAALRERWGVDLDPGPWAAPRGS